MDQTTMRIDIQKTSRGWGCTTYVKHPDFKHEAVTNTGYGTLKSALWHLMLECVSSEYKLLSVVLNGGNMPFDKVWDIVYKALVTGAMAYELPRIRKLLEV